MAAAMLSARTADLAEVTFAPACMGIVTRDASSNSSDLMVRPPPERALAFLADLSGGSEARDALEAASGHLAHVILASTEFLFLN